MSVVSTVIANSCCLITTICKTVTITRFTRRKSPEIWLTLVTLFPKNFVIAITLASLKIAYIVFSAGSVTVTCYYKRKRTLRKKNFMLFTKWVNLRWHPLGPKPHVLGAHLSHFLPTTFGLHSHSPPAALQILLIEPVGLPIFNLFNFFDKFKWLLIYLSNVTIKKITIAWQSIIIVNANITNKL